MQRHSRSLIGLFKSHFGEPQRGAEVGVWQGHNTVALLQAFPTLYMLAVDAWDVDLAQPTMPKEREEMQAAKEMFLAASEFAKDRCSVICNTSCAAAGLVENLSVDFVFIDGCHLYQAVLQDCTVWYPKVRSGGILSGHDYNGVGDRKGRFGVQRAVDQFCGQHKLRVNTLPGLVWYAVKP